MKTTNQTGLLDRLVDPLSDCLNAESIQRLLDMKADPKLQARVDELAAKHNQGLLTPHEQAEYERYVSFGTFVAVLKSKARQRLAATAGE